MRLKKCSIFDGKNRNISQEFWFQYDMQEFIDMKWVPYIMDFLLVQRSGFSSRITFKISAVVTISAKMTLDSNPYTSKLLIIIQTSLP